mgnify:FL=1
MTVQPSEIPKLDTQELQSSIREEYAVVADNPDHGFHFHTGYKATQIMGYDDQWLEPLPEFVVASFSGTGNPFRMGELESGEKVVDIGCGAGIDSLIAGQMVGHDGQVIGVDMTESMLKKARRGRRKADMDQVEFREGQAENLPVKDNVADVVISNGVFNLVPDKRQAVQEMARVLKPGGRLQMGDILVEKPVSKEAKSDIDLWTG